MSKIATGTPDPDNDKLCLQCFRNALTDGDLCHYHAEQAVQRAERMVRFQSRRQRRRGTK